MNKNVIDFIIVNYKSYKMAKILIQSIKKYTEHEYHIYLIDNSDEELLFKSFGNMNNFHYIKGNNNVEQGNFPHRTSAAHSHGLQRGVEAGTGEYICFLDVDTCFLNKWTNNILPELDSHLFVSHRWEPERNIARPQFLITKREYCDTFNINLKEAYQDSGGIFTKKSFEINKPFKILTNSYNDKSLQKYHAVDPGRKIMNDGEQAFLLNTEQPVAFFWHFGRGTLKGIKKEWFELLEKYL